VAGDLYPLATDVELAKFRDSDPQVSLTVKTGPARRVRPELYIRWWRCKLHARASGVGCASGVDG